MNRFCFDFDFLCTEELDDESLSSAYHMMDKHRRARCDRLRSDEAKRLCIAADTLARRMVAKRLDIAEGDVVFYTDDKGKPFVEGDPVYISISHSGRYAMCAVSDMPIGADIQKIGQPTQRIAKMLNTDCSDPLRFFRLWALTESYGKMLGDGVFKVIGRVDFNVADDKISANLDGCDFWLVPCPDSYVAAVCVKAKAHP